MLPPITAAKIAAIKIPIFDNAMASESENATLAITSETVKPIPATAATPNIWRHVAFVGNLHNPVRHAIHVKLAIPTGLPIAKPKTIPMANEE